MTSIFQDKSILLALDNPPTAKMLIGILKILQFKVVDSADDGGQAFRIFKEKNHDIVITELMMNPLDGHYLIAKIRDENSGSPNTRVPVILNAGQSVALDVASIHAEGFTDLLLSPFSFDDVKTRLSYVLKNYEEHSAPVAPEPAIEQGAPNPASSSPEQDQEMVHDLLGHYIAHHEAVLQKLKFAQDATTKSIADVQDEAQPSRSQEQNSVESFSKFESMWGDIIEMFVKGGVAEDDVFKIEKLVSNVPTNIKKHYDELAGQDDDFVEKAASIDHDAYYKTRVVSDEVQEKPNLMTGMTPADYKAKRDKTSDIDMGFIFQPNKKS